MAPRRMKALFFIVTLTFLAIFAGGVLSFFFSHDVELLKTHYPVPVQAQKKISFKLQEERPASWTGLPELSKSLKWAIVLSEDWSFYQHNGVDFNQLLIALEEIVTLGKIRGASTISQQMVKNVFLTEERTLLRKLHELVLTSRAERLLSKDRILEIYFNVIEYGPNLRNIREASWHYFKKSPSQILPREAAFLAMMLPSPSRFYRSFKKKKLTPFARARVDAILIKMRMGKILSMDEYLKIKEEKFSWEN